MCLIIVILNTLYYLANKLYLNVFVYLFLLIKDVYIFTKLLIYFYCDILVN
jgi:hypothetical protein